MRWGQHQDAPKIVDFVISKHRPSNDSAHAVRDQVDFSHGHGKNRENIFYPTESQAEATLGAAGFREGTRDVPDQRVL